MLRNSGFSVGEIIKSRVLTRVGNGGAVRYIRATVLDNDFVDWVGESKEMLKVADEFGDEHEIWADTVFYSE